MSDDEREMTLTELLREAADLIEQQTAELGRLRDENEGYRKANELLNKGMESQCELMDGSKQDRRRLEAELARCRDALKPFAAYAAAVSDEPDGASIDYHYKACPTLGHCRAAAAALGEGE